MTDPTAPISPQETMAQVQSAYQRLRTEVAKTIVGQDQVVDQILMAIFCRGHALVVGVPGLAKTLLISTIARCLSLGFSRVQFTPDLMPSDITGTEVIEEDKTSGTRTLRFVKGPIFANVILADEINRTPPKTQAALLEAMQEHQVTVGGMQHRLPQPFFVLATQNPIEQEGTYPLPEAQLDRFMFEVKISYPSADEELLIVKRKTGVTEQPTAVLTSQEITRVQEVIRGAPVADHVLRYALRLVRATRVKEPIDAGFTRPKMIEQYVGWGAGPRASEYLVLAAKARAILTGSLHVTPEHVRSVAKPVLRHRILTNFNAEADQVTTDAIIDSLIKDIPVEGLSPGEKKQMDAVMREEFMRRLSKVVIAISVSLSALVFISVCIGVLLLLYVCGVFFSPWDETDRHVEITRGYTLSHVPHRWFIEGPKLSSTIVPDPYEEPSTRYSVSTYAIGGDFITGKATDHYGHADPYYWIIDTRTGKVEQHLSEDDWTKALHDRHVDPKSLKLREVEVIDPR